MTKPEFIAALMNAWHLQPLGMNESKRLQAVIEAAWAMRVVAPPTEKVLDEAVACAKMYHHAMSSRAAHMRASLRSPNNDTLARRRVLEALESKIRARVGAAIK